MRRRQARAAQTSSPRGWVRPRSAARGHNMPPQPHPSRPSSERPTSRRGTSHSSPSPRARIRSPKRPPLPPACCFDPPPHKMKPPSTGRTACGSPPAAMKFLALKENTASTGLSLRLVKRYSSAATGRLELSASPGSNGLQPVISTLSGTCGSASADHAKWKTGAGRWHWRNGASRRWRRRAIARAGGPKSFLARHRTLQHARRRAFAFDRDGRENARLVEHVGMVAQRDMREGPCSFQADHARADAAQWKSHLVQILARVLAIVNAPTVTDRRACQPGPRSCWPGPCADSSAGVAPSVPSAPTVAAERLRNLRRGMDGCWCDSLPYSFLSVFDGCQTTRICAKSRTALKRALSEPARRQQAAGIRRAHLDNTTRLRPEIRNPRPETRRKAEARNPNPASRRGRVPARAACDSDLGIRIAFGFRPSDFGFGLLVAARPWLAACSPLRRALPMSA